MSTTEQLANVQTARIDLEYVETVLARFIVGDRKEVLPGIPEIVRAPQRELDEKHINDAKAERIAARRLERGRVRPGHIDTGFQVFSQEEGVGMPTLVEALMRSGYGFRDVHFVRQQKGPKPIWVVVFALEWGQPNAENVEELTRMYAHYAQHSWTSSAWDNPNLVTTITNTKRVRARAARKIVVSSGRYIRIV